MFSRILVPLDGSSFSEHALPYAVQVARGADAEITLALVHVRHSPTATDRTMREVLEAWESAHADQETGYLRALTARIAAEEGVRTHARLLSGDVVPALERIVRDDDMDLVVMTTHGRAGLERAWLGSIADGLLRHLHAPILLIRPTEDAAEPVPLRLDHVLVGLDGSERAERAIEPALALAAPGDGRITLLRVVAPPSAVTSPYLPHAARISHAEMEERQRAAAEYLAAVEARLRPRVPRLEPAAVLGYHAARTILDYAAEHGADLIALGTHGRGPVSRLLMGSVTDKVVRAAGVPVLVC
jgi:nucleotide-binding universal stress UspA family protein